jgi:hypothetical protein
MTKQFKNCEIPDGKIPCDFCDERLACLGDGKANPAECQIIFVNGEPRAIKVKPITFLAHKGDMVLDIPEVVEISSPATLQRSQKLTQGELDFLHVCGVKELFNMVFADVPHIQLPKTINELSQQGTGVNHVVGMLAMIYEAVLDNKQFFLRNPETHLHPSAQAGLADVLVTLATGGSGETVKTEPPPDPSM